MSRRRRLLFTAVVAATLIIATGLPAGAAPPSGGFRLTGADAAYADWVQQDIGDCEVNLFVGFVEAARLSQPLGSPPMPHSDLQAIMTASCPAGPDRTLEGVIQAADCVPGPLTMVSLESADANCDFTISDGSTVEVGLAIALDWTAFGEVFTQTFHRPDNHAAHRTRTATVDGYVTITDVTGAEDLASLAGGALDGASAQPDARITRYNEIQLPVARR